MSDLVVLILLFAVGVLFLVAEIFIPSHGVLTVAGVGFLTAGIVKTFQYGGREAGIISILACAVFLPAFSVIAIKYWHRTPIGRRISPPNPTMTVDDVGVPVEELAHYIGRTGRARTPLRPVGICEFDGRRLSCVAEFGMIEPGTEVEAVRIVGGNLAVHPKQT